MAFTRTRVTDSVTDAYGKSTVQYWDFDITSTYTAGGYTINAKDIGMKFFRGVTVVGGDVSLGTYFPVVDFGSVYTAAAGMLPTTLKLRFFTASGTEATGALSPAINIRLLFIGG